MDKFALPLLLVIGALWWITGTPWLGLGFLAVCVVIFSVVSFAVDLFFKSAG